MSRPLTGSDLRRARRASNLSMQRLAVRLGLLSHTNIAAVENEVRIASQKWLQEAIDACAMPVTEEEKAVCGWMGCIEASKGFYYCIAHRQKSAELTRKSQRLKREKI
jgi:transcriptional regulator with XRE-family HTH domain